MLYNSPLFLKTTHSPADSKQQSAVRNLLRISSKCSERSKFYAQSPGKESVVWSIQCCSSSSYNGTFLSVQVVLQFTKSSIYFPKILNFQHIPRKWTKTDLLLLISLKLSQFIYFIYLPTKICPISLGVEMWSLKSFSRIQCTVLFLCTKSCCISAAIQTTSILGLKN
jgi:hypothetical protein